MISSEKISERKNSEKFEVDFFLFFAELIYIE